eukprot:1346174-Amphidinium_carterae.1
MGLGLEGARGSLWTVSARVKRSVKEKWGTRCFFHTEGVLSRLADQRVSGFPLFMREGAF